LHILVETRRWKRSVIHKQFYKLWTV